MLGTQSRTQIDLYKLFETLPVAIFASDLDGKVTFFNRAIVELFGQEPEIGKEFLNGSIKSCYKKKPLRISDNQTPIKNEEVSIETVDHGSLNVLFSSRPVTDNMGNVTGTVNAFINIAGLKSIDPYHKMIEEVEDYAILSLDSEGNVLNWNKGAQKIKGYTEDEIVGKNFRLFYVEQDRANRLPEKLIAHAIRYGKATHEGWRVRKDGTRFWGSIVITALHNDGKEVTGFTKVTRDLTERKLAEDILSAKAQELEFRNRELEQFAYAASHDLQEPLRKIQVFTDLLENNTKERSSLRFLEKIGSSAKRMSALIKDVLRYAKLSHHDELFREVDLNVVLRNVLTDFELLLEQRNVSIDHGILPVIRGIPVQLEQLFSNIISNAIKFNNNEPLITITSQRVPMGELITYPEINQDREYTKLTMKDNGMGFDPLYAEEVFRLFRRLQNREPGTGIGLALCKKIVENHSGHISVVSEISKGTTFTIVLPVK